MSEKLVLVVNGRVPGPRAHAIATLRLAAALHARGERVEVWAAERRGVAPEVVASEPGEPEIVRLRCTDWIDRASYAWQRATAAWQRASFARSFEREARRRCGDVAWFVLRDASLWSRAVRRGLRFAAEVHELPRRAGARALALAALRAAPRVIALSAVAREALRELGVARDDIAVLPSAADDGLIGASTRRAEAREVLHIGAQERLISYVGHLHAGKGAERLFDLSRALPEVRVRVVGGLPRERARFVRNGVPPNLDIAGFVAPNRIERELAAADLVIATIDPASEAAQRFGSPLKVAEALAAGQALLAPDVPAVRALAGSAAELYPPGDPAEPARSVRRLLGDDAALAGLRARARGAAGDLVVSRRAERLLEFLRKEARA